MVEIFAASFVLPLNSPPIEGGGLLVQDKKIIAVAPLNELKRSYSAPVNEFPGCVIMPGMVNAHTHLELTRYPYWRRAANMVDPSTSYSDWIQEIINVKRSISLDDLEASLREGLSLSIANGTTMVGDILSERRLLPIYSISPLSGRVYLEFIGRDPKRYGANLESLERDIALLSDNFLAGISPHTPFTLSEKLFSLLREKGRGLSLPQSIHLAESLAEKEFFLDSSGAIADTIFPFVGWNDYLPSPMKTTSTTWLDENGWLSQSLLAVHAVHVTEDDIDHLHRNGTTVVICARSNHALGVGMPPLGKLISANIPLAIGTDSMATVASLSMFDELSFLMDSFPLDLSPDMVLRMATYGGAQAIKRDDCAGTLEAGKRADFIVVKVDGDLRGGKLAERIITSPDIEAVYVAGAIAT
ncbi:MAG: amidohydrolase family protein [Geobacteraceae bacterium]|nr:amidohydrolase family protein [Geobacteraceae bacterium]